MERDGTNESKRQDGTIPLSSIVTSIFDSSHNSFFSHSRLASRDATGNPLLSALFHHPPPLPRLDGFFFCQCSLQDTVGLLFEVLINSAAANGHGYDTDENFSRPTSANARKIWTSPLEINRLINLPRE